MTDIAIHKVLFPKVPVVLSCGQRLWLCDSLLISKTGIELKLEELKQFGCHHDISVEHVEGMMGNLSIFHDSKLKLKM